MEQRDKGFTLFKKGKSCNEIASALGVSVNTVKSWRKRYWKGAEVAPKAHPKTDAPAPDGLQRKRGAPKGNVNAVGNKGGAPPMGNTNSVRHGGYAEVMFGSYAADHRRVMQECEPPTEEELLVQEIDLLTLRERYLLDCIQACEDKPLHVQRVSSTKSKPFEGTEPKTDAEVAADITVNTVTESAYMRVERLERLLTPIQRQKSRAIAQLASLREKLLADGVGGVVKENNLLEMIRECTSEDISVDELSEIQQEADFDADLVE